MLSSNGNRQRRKSSKKYAVPYKPKIEYTDDGFAVTTLYLRSLGKDLRREHLLHHFSTFGKVQNVRIHSKTAHAFGFVTFARAESAAKALAKRSHQIGGCHINVDVADSWHQEKPLELSNNKSAAKRNVVLPIPIELTNATGTHFLDLNDDCLYEILSLKFVQITDLCSVAESCTRLKQIADRIISAQHKCCDLNALPLKTLHEVRRFLINFGSTVEDLAIGPTNDFEEKVDGMSARVLDLVIRYCSQTLKSLTLRDYEITDHLTAKLRPMFNNLQKLCIMDGYIEGPSKQLFSNCSSLIELKVYNWESDEFGLIFENRFPKLERFKYKKEYDDYDDYNLAEFVSRHKGLKTFSMKHFNDDCTSLLPIIAANCKDLETLQIEGEGEANQSNYVNALQSLLTLDKLTKLKIKCAKVNVTEFVQELHKLSSLEFLELWHAESVAECIPALSQMKNLNVLRLSYCNGLDNLNTLANLEKLNELSITVRSPAGEIEFDIVRMIERLINLKKLTLGMDTFQMKKGMYCKIVNVVRGRPGRNPSFLEIRTNTIDDDVADLQFDGKNDQFVKLEKIVYSEDESDDDFSDEYSDSDFDPFFDTDDDDDDDDDDGYVLNHVLRHALHPAVLLPFLEQGWLNGAGNNDEDDGDSDENEVW